MSTFQVIQENVCLFLPLSFDDVIKFKILNFKTLHTSRTKGAFELKWKTFF